MCGRGLCESVGWWLTWKRAMGGGDGITTSASLDAGKLSEHEHPPTSPRFSRDSLGVGRAQCHPQLPLSSHTDHGKLAQRDDEVPPSIRSHRARRDHSLHGGPANDYTVTAGAATDAVPLQQPRARAVGRDSTRASPSTAHEVTLVKCCSETLSTPCPSPAGRAHPPTLAALSAAPPCALSLSRRSDTQGLFCCASIDQHTLAFETVVVVEPNGVRVARLCCRLRETATSTPPHPSAHQLRVPFDSRALST